jgi:hypothetical protein
MYSSESSVLARTTRRHISEDGILSVSVLMVLNTGLRDEVGFSDSQQEVT